jgi:1,4-dihydroxy-2-naphthoyl-CoA hydrolase
MPSDAFTGHLDVRLHHTDAAGVMFFARAFEFEQECFERWLEAGGMGVRAMLDGSSAPTPVVHCAADYLRPVRAGDRMDVRMAGVGIGRSSFELGWEMRVGGATAISLRVRRAALDRGTGRSADIPAPLRAWLEASQARTSALS